MILVHHSNRQGGARGHSKPEDVMNLLIKLTRPDDYRADQGARFHVEFDKARGAHGAAVAPFTARLTGAGWEIESDGDRSVPARLRDYLRLADGAGDRPRSANAAIAAARVNRNRGLEAWGEMLARKEIVLHPSGGFTLAE